jgi:hypothetical protein
MADFTLLGKGWSYFAVEKVGELWTARGASCAKVKFTDAVPFCGRPLLAFNLVRLDAAACSTGTTLPSEKRAYCVETP